MLVQNTIPSTPIKNRNSKSTAHENVTELTSNQLHDTLNTIHGIDTTSTNSMKINAKVIQDEKLNNSGTPPILNTKNTTINLRKRDKKTRQRTSKIKSSTKKKKNILHNVTEKNDNITKNNELSTSNTTTPCNEATTSSNVQNAQSLNTPIAEYTALRSIYLQELYRYLQITHSTYKAETVQSLARHIEKSICTKSENKTQYVSQMADELHKHVTAAASMTTKNRENSLLKNQDSQSFTSINQEFNTLQTSTSTFMQSLLSEDVFIPPFGNQASSKDTNLVDEAKLSPQMKWDHKDKETFQNVNQHSQANPYAWTFEEFASRVQYLDRSQLVELLWNQRYALVQLQQEQLRMNNQFIQMQQIINNQQQIIGSLNSVKQDNSTLSPSGYNYNSYNLSKRHEPLNMPLDVIEAEKHRAQARQNSRLQQYESNPYNQPNSQEHLQYNGYTNMASQTLVNTSRSQQGLSNPIISTTPLQVQRTQYIEPNNPQYAYSTASSKTVAGQNPALYWERVVALRTLYASTLSSALRLISQREKLLNPEHQAKVHTIQNHITVAAQVLNERPNFEQPRPIEYLDKIEKFIAQKLVPILQMHEAHTNRQILQENLRTDTSLNSTTKPNKKCSETPASNFAGVNTIREPTFVSNNESTNFCNNAGGHKQTMGARTPNTSSTGSTVRTAGSQGLESNILYGTELGSALSSPTLNTEQNGTYTTSEKQKTTNNDRNHLESSIEISASTPLIVQRYPADETKVNYTTDDIFSDFPELNFSSTTDLSDEIGNNFLYDKDCNSYYNTNAVTHEP